MRFSRGSKGQERLVVACRSNSKERIHATLALHAGFDWTSDVRIAVLALPNGHAEDGQYVTARLNEIAAGAPNGIRVVAVHVAVLPERLRGDIVLARDAVTLRSSYAVLRWALKAMGLDYETRALQRIRAWIHGSINPGQVDEWLSQFDRLGSHRWVGENLLRLLEVVTAQDLVSAFGLEEFEALPKQRYCVVDSVKGKSAGIVANIVRKHLTRPLGPRVAVDELYEVLERGGDGDVEPIVVFEDGIFSGTEQSGILDSLLNARPEGRRSKVPPLSDPERLRRRRVEIRFGVGANLGLFRLRSYLDERGLINITVRSPARLLNVLSPMGVEAARGGTLFVRDSDPDELVVASPDEYLRPVAFADEGRWKDSRRASIAQGFCRLIGRQLWRNYIESMGWIWSERRLEESALGMRGQGLTLAFFHSVPKAALPLFWATGGVEFQRKAIEWKPLFPNAA